MTEATVPRENQASTPGGVLAAFRSAASTVGLAAEMRPAQPGIGFADLTLQPGTARVYAAQLAELTEALSSWTPPASAAARSRTGLAARCSCAPPRVIRASESTLEQGGTRCEICGALFEAS